MTDLYEPEAVGFLVATILASVGHFIAWKIRIGERPAHMALGAVLFAWGILFSAAFDAMIGWIAGCVLGWMTMELVREFRYEGPDAK